MITTEERLVGKYIREIVTPTINKAIDKIRYSWNDAQYIADLNYLRTFEDGSKPVKNYR